MNSGRNTWMNVAAIVALLFVGAMVAQAAEQPNQGTWLAAVEETAPPAAPTTAASEQEAPAPTADSKGMPIPFHCIEGYSGGIITPLAYLCNGDNSGENNTRGPSVSYSYVNISTKHLHTFAVTQTFFNRIEVGYALNRLTLGSFIDDLEKAGLDPVREDVLMHNFNLRAKILDENSFDLPLPAVTAGVHFKYNYGIDQINRHLGHALDSIGFDKNYGIDYTITASKMFPKLLCGRPVVVTGGGRFSKASQIGLLGFGDTCKASFEGSVIALPTDWLVVGYEFRQKHNPYNEIPGLVGDEDNWHAISASVIVNKHLTISALAALMGNLANANADTSWGLQIKYEF